MSEPGLTINSLCYWHLEIFLSNLSTEEWAALKSLSKRKDAVIKAADKRRRGSCLADRPLPTKISLQPTKKLSKKLFRMSLTNNNYQWPVPSADMEWSKYFAGKKVSSWFSPRERRLQHGKGEALHSYFGSHSPTLKQEWFLVKGHWSLSSKGSYARWNAGKGPAFVIFLQWISNGEKLTALHIQ